MKFIPLLLLLLVSLHLEAQTTIKSNNWVRNSGYQNCYSDESGEEATGPKKNKMSIGFHAYFGIAPTGNYTINPKENEPYEKLSPSGFAGFTFSNNRGQRHFFETGLSYGAFAYKTFKKNYVVDVFELTWHLTELESEIRNHLISIPFYAGINHKRFVLKLGAKIGFGLFNTTVVNSIRSNSYSPNTKNSTITKTVNINPQDYQIGPAANFGFHIYKNWSIHVDVFHNVLASNINNQINIGVNYQLRKQKK